MKHIEEMKIAGLAMALCIVMLGIYIVVPKDGTTSHLTAIPDNNAVQPVTDSASQDQSSADTGNDDYFPVYTEDSYNSSQDDSYSDGASYTADSDYSSDDNSDNGYSDDDADNSDTGDTGSDDTPADDNSDDGSDDGVIDDGSYGEDTSDSDLGNDTGDTGNDNTVEVD